MGLLDFFRNQKSDQSKYDLSLENLLQKAATEPAYRGQFYKRLLSDDLVVITKDTKLPDGNQTLEQDSSVNILTLADGIIPVFTSTERIFDKGIVKEEIQFIQMKGENLFGLSKGVTFILNPYSDYGKELLPDEIERLLNGKIFTDSSATLKMQTGSKVLIGQPEKYPTDIVNSLKVLFANNLSVKAAYLGWIDNPKTGEGPHCIIGIDADGDIKTLIQEAGFTVKEFLNINEFVDFIKIDGKGGISDYLSNRTKPFYAR